MKKFAGINIYPITLEESLRKVETFVSSGKYHYQISLNAAKFVEAQKDSKLLTIINEADILNADGTPIKLITQIICKKRTSRLGGLDYMDGLAAMHPEYKYYFLGSTDESVSKTVNYYKTNYNLNIVGWRNGYFGKQNVKEVIDEINQKGTDILFIALGTPAKEYFLYDNKDILECKFAVGVGGAFNIVAGFQKRAPESIQKIGFEWLYRLLQEPKRMWKRYLIGNFLFLFLVLKQVVKKVI